MPEPTPPVPPKRSWPRRLLLGAAGAVALLALVLAGSGVWLARTEAGTAWLLSRFTIVTGSSGRLLGGPFSAERAEVKLGTRILTLQGLSWQDARWTWRPHESAWIGLVLVAPRVQRIELQGSGSDEPLTRPTSLRMPLTLLLQDARVDALHVEDQLPITQIQGSATLGARGGAEHRIADLAFTWDRARVQARGSVASDAPFAVDVRADARSVDGTAPAWHASGSASGPLERLALQVQLGSERAPGATLRAEAGIVPFAAWPLATLSANAQALDLAALGSGLPATRLSGRADIDARGLDQPVTARVAIGNELPGRWDQQRLPVTSLDLELAGVPSDRARLSVRRLALQLVTGAGRIDGSGEWQAGTATLALQLHALRPALLDARAAPMTLSGGTSIELVGLPSPDGRTALAAVQQLKASLALDGRIDARSELPVHLSARLDGERDAKGLRLDLPELLLRSRDARVQGSVGLRRTLGGDWQLKSRGELAAFDPALWFAPAHDSPWRKGPHRLAGRWQADLRAGPALAEARDLGARLLALRGEADLQLQDSLLAGAPLQGRLRLDGLKPGWAVDADLRSAANHAALQGRLAPRPGDDRWRLALDLPALAALQPLVDLEPGTAAALRGRGQTAIAGRLAGELRVEGRWPALRVDTQLRAGALQAADVRAARLDLKAQAGPDAQAPLLLQLDAEQLAFETMRADALTARVEGSLAQHRLALDVQSPARPPAWSDAVLGSPPSGTRAILRGSGEWSPADARQALLPGRWSTQALEFELRDRAAPASAPAWLRARGLQAALQLDAQGRPVGASAEPGRIEVLGNPLRWTTLQWRAATPNAAAEARIDLELDPVPVAPWLHRLQPAAGLGGDLLLRAHAHVEIGQRVHADVVLERAGGDLTRTDETGTQSFGLTDLRLAIAAQEGVWHFTQAAAGSNVGVLAGAQSLRLPPQARWPRTDSPMEGVLEWQIADLGAWAPFTPVGWRLGGALRVSAALGGTFGAPEVTGNLTGTRLALRNLLEGVDLRDGELALSLRGDEARIERFVLKAGKGELRASGGASLGAEPHARLQLEADRFQLLGRVDRRIVTSGKASLDLTRQALNLDGRFHIDEGLVDFSRGDAPSLDSDVRVRGGRHAATVDAPDASDTVPRGNGNGNGSARNVQAALRVELGDDLTVRGRGLDTKLRGDLALSTPGGQLAVNGRVRTEAGTYAAYGQKLEIERGVLVFSGAANDPRLDILALRPNLDVRVGVQVSGSAQLPRVRLFSEPDMSDTDKLSWLVLGRAPDEVGSTDMALLQRAALGLLAGEGQGADAALLSRLGLDELSVRQSDTGEVRDTVVTLGKQLSRRWYVGYERSMNSTTGTWQLIYRVARRFTVRAQAGEDNALDAIWAWRWN